MGRTTATAVHAAAVVLVLGAVLTGGPSYAAVGPVAHDHPAPSPTATPMDDMPGMSAEEHAAMGHGGHAPVASVATDAGVSDQTRVAVLGGFGALNAAVVGGALVLRRRSDGRGRPRYAR